MKFNPVLAFYLAAGVAGAVGAVMFYKKFFGPGGYFDQTGVILDQAATDYGYNQAVNAAQVYLSYDQARSKWFRDHHVSGSDAFSLLASTPGVPTEAQFNAGQPFPA